MKASSLRFRAVLVGGVLSGATVAAAAQPPVNVTQYHNHATRDGLYTDPALTKTAAAGLTRDMAFDGGISGNVYAQPLYIEDRLGGNAKIIVVTGSNNVYALEAATGAVIWQRQVGVPVPLSSLPCGNIDPLGITGTPVVDLASRTLVFDAMTTPDDGTTKWHLIYALNVDTGTTNSGWPIDVNVAARFQGRVFTWATQNQRGALGLLGGIVYVAYGGHSGDCGLYRGWIVGVPLKHPGQVTSWATPANGGGAWSVGGVASGGVEPIIATGNTFGATVWSGGEAIIRFQVGPLFSRTATDYWAPPNWRTLDNHDTDIGGSGPLILSVPGATPRAMVVSLGKDGKIYLINRTTFGGVRLPVAEAQVSSTPIIQAAATYRTVHGTYVVFCGNANESQLTALRIVPHAPPIITHVWSQSEFGWGSPFVTTTDGTNNVIVWGIGAEGDQRLHGFDGDTGNVVFDGDGANELMANTRHFVTGIAARGRIYVAADNKVYAFTLPVSSGCLENPNMAAGGSVSEVSTDRSQLIDKRAANMVCRAD